MQQYNLLFNVNSWKRNYWSDSDGSSPKFIRGELEIWMLITYIYLPWFEIDWNPAQEPYDIGVQNE